jgi:hypothetical protein
MRLFLLQDLGTTNTSNVQIGGFPGFENLVKAFGTFAQLANFPTADTPVIWGPHPAPTLAEADEAFLEGAQRRALAQSPLIEEVPPRVYHFTPQPDANSTSMEEEYPYSTEFQVPELTGTVEGRLCSGTDVGACNGMMWQQVVSMVAAVKFDANMQITSKVSRLVFPFINKATQLLGTINNTTDSTNYTFASPNATYTGSDFNFTNTTGTDGPFNGTLDPRFNATYAFDHPEEARYVELMFSSLKILILGLVILSFLFYKGVFYKTNTSLLERDPVTGELVFRHRGESPQKFSRKDDIVVVDMDKVTEMTPLLQKVKNSLQSQNPLKALETIVLEPLDKENVLVVKNKMGGRKRKYSKKINSKNTISRRNQKGTKKSKGKSKSKGKGKTVKGRSKTKTTKGKGRKTKRLRK